MARPLFEPDELMRLPKDEAVVIAGPDGPYQDKKQQVWKCRRYDKTYMSRHPKRSFDYMSWKKAGKPYGEKFHAWEGVHFNEVLPARDDLEKKRQAHKWAKNRGDRKRESETMKKLVESCDRLVRAERHAREAAMVSDQDSQS
jgi:type IV secretory pathway TraG/TraD family ATPase VirD4